MVYEWGMSEKMGPIKYTEEQDGMMGHESVVTAGGETRRELEQEVRLIIDTQYARAVDVISKHREAMVRIAETLLDHETLDCDQVRRLVDGETLPPRQSTVVIKKKPTTDDADDAIEPAKKDDAGPEGLTPSLA